MELTDLGACSYLDHPQEVERTPLPPWSLTENLKACVTSGGFATTTAVTGECTADLDGECEVLAPARRPTPSPSSSAAADAFARARSRGNSDTTDRTRITARVRPPSTSTPPGIRNAAPSPRPSRESDPLDDALRDFLGERRLLRDSEDVRLIYGDVFDPEEAAAKHASARNMISRSVKAVETEESFGWDDDELDAPIDPEHVRRKYGSRSEGVPQFAVFKRKNRPPSDG